ncbi:GPW/gp25 family protein [Marinimicrobium sp. ARAG 43.8]|uniref:GPW/gp25 family protein n=1 Tax=Marinimicrobium sp. ARAG 43.8 TaxID=3418719 RepID=UPI003CE73CD1
MRGMNAKTGKALQGIDHIRQSLTDILATPVGSRTMRRDYGSLLPDLIDQPLNATTLLQSYAAAAISIAQFEPRVQVEKISRAVNAERPGTAQLTVELVRLDTGTTERAQLALTLPNGQSA